MALLTGVCELSGTDCKRLFVRFESHRRLLPNKKPRKPDIYELSIRLPGLLDAHMA